MLASLYTYGFQGNRPTFAKECECIDASLDIMLEKRETSPTFTWLSRRREGEDLDEFASRFIFLGMTDQLTQTVAHLARIVGQPSPVVRVPNKDVLDINVLDGRDGYSLYAKARKAMEPGFPLGWVCSAWPYAFIGSFKGSRAFLEVT